MNVRKKVINIPENKGKKKEWKFTFLIVLAFGVLIFHNFFGAIAYNTFVIADNAFCATGTRSPIFMWSVIGLLTGAGAGSVIAVRKFKLSKKIFLFSGAPLAVLLFVLLIASGPIGQITPRPDTLTEENGAIDSTSYSAVITNKHEPYKPKKRATIISKKLQQEVEPIKKTCEQKVAGISVTVRSDSVRLFFRTTAIKGGEWSRWESIFIPQPGQYALSGANGKVFANSIQYYYEAKLEATRSANDPFSRYLCNGPLSIDTY